MTSAEVQELIDSVPCDLCNMSPGLVQYAILAALIDVSNGDPVPDTTQELVSEANCLLCAVPPGLVPFLMIQAIRGITTGGGGGGGGGLFGAGSPEGVVTATRGTTYWNTTAPQELWVKNAGSGNTGWVLALTL